MRKNRRIRCGDVITLSACTTVVTAVLVLSVMQVRDHYLELTQPQSAATEVVAEAPQTAAPDAQSDIPSLSDKIASRVSGSSAQIASQGSDSTSAKLATQKNYQVLHQERINDGIHTTNENQRNGALEDIMRTIADETNN